MSVSDQSTRNLFVVLSISLLTTVISCKNSADQPAAIPNTVSDKPPALPAISATQFLQNTFLRYRNTSRYHDDGHVRLRVKIDGRFQQEQAPLSVALNQDRFLLKAYDVRVWSNAKSIMSWLDDPTTDHHDGQVRLQSRSAVGRPTPEELLADAIIAERLQAGLGGIAPQLDWLLANKPMERLFGQPNSIEYDSIKKLGDDWCVIILVQSESDQYCFWINRRSSLIRRVELPVPKEIEAGLVAAHPNQSVEIESLELELDQASFETPTHRIEKTDLPPTPKYVRALVPLPPPKPTNIIGRMLPDVNARNAAGQTRLTSRGSDREVTVVLLVGDASRKGSPEKFLDAATMQSIAALSDWIRVMPEKLKSRIRCLVLSSDAVAEHLATSVNQNSLPLLIDSNRILPHREQLVHGDVIVIDKRGTIAWIQKGVRMAGLPAMGAIVSDVLNGVDVPHRLIKQWQSDQSAYEKKLNELTIRQNPK